MKRAALWIGLVTLSAFAAGVFVARFSRDVQEVKKERSAPAPRMVPDSWPQVRLSPGHSQHVVNQGLECDECHDPSLDTFETPDTGVCTQCHEEQAALSHLNADGTPTDCYTCHVFSAKPEVFGKWDCTRCHGPFQTEDIHQGLAMHASVPCENCHDPHKPVKETVLQCGECHKKMNVQHGQARGNTACTNCHGGHRRASEATACMKCHATQEPRVPKSATFVGGHESCTTCHRPHNFSAASASECASCHRKIRVLAQDKVRKHQDCMSCHQQHAVRDLGRSTCTHCHSRVAATHPGVGGKSNCVSCHEPHSMGRKQVALACTDCHKEARSMTAFHSKRTKCTDCHQPHRFDLNGLADRALCVRCHARQIRLTSRNLGHSSCRGCHEGTLHELTGVAACKTCHQKQFANSQARAGHIKCLNCHEPHSGRVSPETSCAGCHNVDELPGLHHMPEQPPGEGHHKCTACHEMHQAQVHADRATCMACHKDVANHQPDAKRCTGCHTFISGR